MRAVTEPAVAFTSEPVVIVTTIVSSPSSSASSGTVTEIEPTPLLTMEEAITAMGKAGDAVGIYQPPGRTETSAD